VHFTPLSKVIAVSASALLGVGLIAAPGALAYPPGNEPAFGVNRTQTNPGQQVRAVAQNVQATCLIRFQLRDADGKILRNRTRLAPNDNGQRGQVFRMPNATGTYYLGMVVYGKNCTSRADTISILRVV